MFAVYMTLLLIAHMVWCTYSFGKTTAVPVSPRSRLESGGGAKSTMTSTRVHLELYSMQVRQKPAEIGTWKVGTPLRAMR